VIANFSSRVSDFDAFEPKKDGRKLDKEFSPLYCTTGVFSSSAKRGMLRQIL